MFGGFLGNIVSDAGKDISKAVTDPVGAVKGLVNSVGDLPSSIGNFVNNPLQSIRKNPDLQAAMIAAMIASGGAGLAALGGTGAAGGAEAGAASGGSGFLSSLFGGSSAAGSSSGGIGSYLSSLFGGGGASGITDASSGAIGSSLPGMGGATDAFGSTPFGMNLTASGATGDLSSLFGGSSAAGNLLGSDAASSAASGGIGSYIKDGAGIMSILGGLQSYQAAAQRQKQQAAYGTQLQQLMANPSSVTSTPGYQAGLDAVTRTLAAQGYNNSSYGASMIADYGGQAFQQQVNNLESLQGSGQPFSTSNASTQIGQGLGSLVSGLGGNTPQNSINPQMLQMLLKVYGAQQ